MSEEKNKFSNIKEYSEEEKIKIKELEQKDFEILKKEQKFISTIEKWEPEKYCTDLVKFEDLEKNLYIFLDSQIEKIEEMLFRCYDSEKISEILDIPIYKFYTWTKKTRLLPRILTALEYSSEFRMGMSQKVLERYINDPKLTPQMTMLIRELSLHHSRMAGFRNQKTFGKTPDPSGQQSPVMFVDKDGMAAMIDAMKQKRIEESKVDEHEEISDSEYESSKNEESEEFNLNEL